MSLSQAKKQLSKMAGDKRFVTEYFGSETLLNLYLNDSNKVGSVLMDSFSIHDINAGVWAYGLEDPDWLNLRPEAPCPVCERITTFRPLSNNSAQCKTCGDHFSMDKFKVQPVMASQTDQEILKNVAKLEKFRAKQANSDEFGDAVAKTRAYSR